MLKKTLLAAAVATACLQARAAEPARGSANSPDRESVRRSCQSGPGSCRSRHNLALPLPVLDLQYEDTVRDVETQARRLLAFLDLPWDDRCLEFHRNERAVQTPSRWQVRQPIYSRAVGRWRDYASHLQPLRAAFPLDPPAA